MTIHLTESKLKSMKKKKYLSFDEAVQNKMNFETVIRYYEPEATEEKCITVYNECWTIAYKAGLLGRRTELNEGMLFDAISHYYKELYLNK